MASKFPGDFAYGGFPSSPFHQAAFQRNAMFPFHQQAMTVHDALQLSKFEWSNIRQQLGVINSALTKLLGKSKEKPTLEKIISSSTDEKLNVLSEHERQILANFFRIVFRLEKVMNAMPIGKFLKEKVDINTILSKTTVHSTVHEDISDAINNGVSISSRFQATISVVPRVLDTLCSIEGIPVERISRKEPKKQKDEARARSLSPDPTQQSDDGRRRSWEGSSKGTPFTTQHAERSHSQDETEPPKGFHMRDDLMFEGELFSDPDVQFQMLMSFDDLWYTQRRAQIQHVYAKKCAENHQLRLENATLLQQIEEHQKEIENLKKPKEPQRKEPSPGAMDMKKSTRDEPREDQIENILKRLERLEAGQSSSNTNQRVQTERHNQLDDHLKYFHRRLAEYKPSEQTNFIYKSANFAAGYFDERGGFLEIDLLNVSLFIPPGAIKSGSKSEIYIYVDTDKYPQACSGKDGTVVAPVVQCGPPGIQFQESVVLTFPHCADEEENWSFQPITCQSDDSHQENGEWENLTSDDAICIVEKGRTILMVNHFTLYTLTGEKKDGKPVVKKKMRVGAFGPSFSSEKESYRFRVWAWDDTEAAHDHVLKKEERLSGQQLDADRPIKIASTGEPVDVNVKNVKAGWKNRDYEPNGQQISFDDLWQQSSLPSCTFDLEVDTSNINNNPENDINHRVKSGVHCQVDMQQQQSKERPVNLKIDVHENTQGDFCTKSETFSGAVQEKIFGPSDPGSGLSRNAYFNLCEHLNIENAALLDWRRLAEKLGCNVLNIENIKANKKEEPAKLVLKVFFSVWNATKRSGSAIDFLKKILKELGLVAAAKVIEDDLADRMMLIE